VRIDALTIFPGIFESPLRESLLGKAIEAGIPAAATHLTWVDSSSGA